MNIIDISKLQKHDGEPVAILWGRQSLSVTSQQARPGVPAYVWQKHKNSSRLSQPFLYSSLVNRGSISEYVRCRTATVRNRIVIASAYNYMRACQSKSFAETLAASYHCLDPRKCCTRCQYPGMRTLFGSSWCSLTQSGNLGGDSPEYFALSFVVVVLVVVVVFTSVKLSRFQGFIELLAPRG